MSWFKMCLHNLSNNNTILHAANIVGTSLILFWPFGISFEHYFRVHTRDSQAKELSASSVIVSTCASMSMFPQLVYIGANEQ